MADDSLLDDLPPNLPADLRAFIECTGDQAVIANGPVAWVDIPPNVRGMLGGATRPELTVVPGKTPGSAVITVKAGWVSATLPASVSGGKLAIDTAKLPFLAPKSIGVAIQEFVVALNGRLAANGKALGAPSFSSAGMTLSKVDATR